MSDFSTEKRPAPPTQNCIAKMLGISGEAVSHILKGTPKKKYSEATRRRVIEAAAALNYRPHRAAQLMRGGKSGTIGMINMLSYYEGALARYEAVSEAIYDSGYKLLTSTITGSLRRGLAIACDTMIDMHVEGVIIDLPLPDYVIPHIKRMEDAGILIVTLCGDRISGVPHATQDIQQGMREMTHHLISLGHRRLTLVVPEVVVMEDGYREFSMSARVSGFQEAVGEVGLTETEIFYQPIIPAVTNLYEHGVLAGNQILEREQLPEAILCPNDYWAVGLFKACSDKGLHVPQDIAITGFDSTQIGQVTASPLTTTRHDPKGISEKIVKLLMARIQNQKILPEDQFLRFPFQLIVRESCGAPAPLRTPLQTANLTEAVKIQSGHQTTQTS